MLDIGEGALKHQEAQVQLHEAQDDGMYHPTAAELQEVILSQTAGYSGPDSSRLPERDTLISNEIYPLSELAVIQGQSQLIEIGGKQYEIGINEEGRVFVRNNGTIYLVHYVRADEVNFRYKLFAGTSQTAQELRSDEGMEITNVSSLRMEDGQLYADYRSGETFYAGIKVPMAIFYVMLDGLDQDADEFVIDDSLLDQAIEYADERFTDEQFSPSMKKGLSWINKMKVYFLKVPFHRR